MQYDDMVREGARHFHARHGCGTPSLRNTVLRYLFNCIHVGITVLAPLAGLWGTLAAMVLVISGIGIGIGPFGTMDEYFFSLFGMAAFGWLIFYGCMKILPLVQEKIEQLETERDRGGDIAEYNREGNIYYGVRDYGEAKRWYHRGANVGDADAQYNLGEMYRKGQGVERNYAKAMMWYRKAADQGLARAQFALGFLYYKSQEFKGRGVPQDYAEAAKWFHRAADQGDADAQCNLGAMYANGEGVTQDYVEALKWLYLAISLKTDTESLGGEAKNREII